MKVKGMRSMFIRVHVVLRDNVDFNFVIFSKNYNFFSRNEENTASESKYMTVDDDPYDGLFYR